MINSESFAGVGSTIASLMFLWAVCKQYFPNQLENYFSKYYTKFITLIYPYIEISFPEYSGQRLKLSEAYTAIESYLSNTTSERAKRLKAEMGHDSDKLILSMAENEEITDEFRGVKLWWYSNKISSNRPTISFYPTDDDKRSYRLTFHRRHRALVNDSYLPLVIQQGKAIAVQKRKRKLYTNSSNFDYSEFRKLVWSHVAFEHPATFETLAMEPEMKLEIIQDLVKFSKSKEYYAKIGKPWKRGYLLFGPPGTGKSTMIAAMANLLDYDVYDLELTAVKDNSALRRLLLNTTSKSIIVVEDIDCSLDLSGKRKTGGDQQEGNKEEEEKKKAMGGPPGKEESKVTLSGLLNCIDGLWSACGGEKLIVFTTNHIEKLDPALIRRGRMDKHIELGFCGYEGFKVLAKNYLGVESHPLFDSIHELLKEKKMSPADVAENLMPKNESEDQADLCLQSLVKALKECKSENEKDEEEEGEQEKKKVKTDEEKSVNDVKVGDKETEENKED
ncbi:AAA-ATPase ASD, mitochondrial-like [Dioscorea cayenensis subsp. rotundata]|uniref:AAA-ATPase ASD, mitochondrial-like n=1 Tax=Dioscorea cayennensis subsp. rotundata TaxID=55577 RepID=A0AB40CGN0_DIOCR|nr:AAA-ATPase ASD, mitochondrial-like [Dioscorea cayenensis subsp. rotundata]